ncbi:hypothetical protein UA70_01270 [Raoultella planticola]|nr:hypothetical protein UA70_01270 [Raoultella planticola]
MVFTRLNLEPHYRYDAREHGGGGAGNDWRLPFFARLTENALDEVDYGRIEAILSMGGTVWHVIFKSLLPEAR